MDMKLEGVVLPVTDVDQAKDSYASFGSFSDPDGNTWLLQQITTRFPDPEEGFHG